eukprot:SAG11_NODE_50_length_19992_cov_9.945157_15_plen_193_part_00
MCSSLYGFAHCSYIAELSSFLSEHYGDTVEPERLVLTSGATAGCSIICSLFFKPGDPVFIEDPSYFLAVEMFRDYGLRMISVDSDQEGTQHTALAVAAAAAIARPSAPSTCNIAIDSTTCERRLHLRRHHGGHRCRHADGVARRGGAACSAGCTGQWLGLACPLRSRSTQRQGGRRSATVLCLPLPRPLDSS